MEEWLGTTSAELQLAPDSGMGGFVVDWNAVFRGSKQSLNVRRRKHFHRPTTRRAKREREKGWENVIKERETFDSAYPNIKGHSYYRNSCLRGKKKKRVVPFVESFIFRIEKIEFFLDINRMCVCHSIKIKFKVNGGRLFLVLFLVALHFRRYEKIYIYIYLRLRRESRYYSCGASAFLVSDFYSFAFETCLRYKTRPRFSTFREPQP